VNRLLREMDLTSPKGGNLQAVTWESREADVDMEDAKAPKSSLEGLEANKHRPNADLDKMDLDRTKMEPNNCKFPSKPEVAYKTCPSPRLLRDHPAVADLQSDTTGDETRNNSTGARLEASKWATPKAQHIRSGYC
jgi:hypothetical protein